MTLDAVVDDVDLDRTERPRPGPWWYPVAVFLGIALVLATVVWTSWEHLSHEENPADENLEVVGGDLVRGWLGYDTGWYYGIVAEGYDDAEIAQFHRGEQSAVAFFPSYPLAARQVAEVLGTPEDEGVEAMMLTTFLSGLGVALLFWRWCGPRLSADARRLALILFLAYPYAWFIYLTGYADAFFLVSVLGAFVLLERGHPVLAGLAAVAATAGRPIGAAVVVGLLAVALDRDGALTRTASPTPFSWLSLVRRDGPAWRDRLRAEQARWRFDRSRLRPASAGVLFALAGLIAWCAFLYARTDDPFAFATVQGAPGWDQPAGFETWFKRSFFGHLKGGEPWFALRLVMQASLTAGFLLAAPHVGRRFGWAYGVYVFAIVGLPALGTHNFQGMGRYLLAAFPVFALAAEWAWARGRRLSTALAGTSFLALVVLTQYFARGYYLT